MAEYSFGGLPFGPRVSDLVPRVTPGELLWGERHVPGSDFNVVDLGGRGSRKFPAQIRIPVAGVVAFEAKLGFVDTLVINGVSYGSAVLAQLNAPQMTPLPITDRQYVFYDALFLLVTEDVT